MEHKLPTLAILAHYDTTGLATVSRSRCSTQFLLVVHRGVSFHTMKMRLL